MRWPWHGAGAISTALVGLGSDPAPAAGLVLVGAGIIGHTGIWVAGRNQPSQRAATSH